MVSTNTRDCAGLRKYGGPGPYKWTEHIQYDQITPVNIPSRAAMPL
jgi:hypothetical protein